MKEKMRQHVFGFNLAAEFLRKKLGCVPDCAVVLGSGLAPLAEGEAIQVIDYSEIPAFKQSTAPGHSGKLVLKEIGGRKVLLMKGRLHCYEGYDVLDTVLPVRAFAKLGIKKLILTNAAGGINLDFSEGALMMITDHLGFNAPPVLWGANVEELGPRFSDMTFAYSREMMEKAREAAKEQGVKLCEGVYAYTKGAQYETPAEIRMYKLLGADAVGMSTVPEVIAARHAGMETLAISCITNMAAGITGKELTHQEVLDTANRVMGDFIKLVTAVIAKL
jgi:purine-nucleoside phosphorylase